MKVIYEGHIGCGYRRSTTRDGGDLKSFALGFVHCITFDLLAAEKWSGALRLYRKRPEEPLAIVIVESVRQSRVYFSEGD